MDGLHIAEDITRSEESCLEDDNLCCLKGGFLIEGVGVSVLKLHERRKHGVGGAVGQGLLASA